MNLRSASSIDPLPLLGVHKIPLIHVALPLLPFHIHWYLSNPVSRGFFNLEEYNMETSVADVAPALTRVPVKIWEQIFGLVASPCKTQLNPAYGWGFSPPYREALRMAQTLSVICRGWCTVSLRNIYSSVVFGSLSQLPRFLQTLWSNPKTICPIITSISTHFPTPIGASNLVRQCLSEIMSRCLWLQELTIVIDDFPHCEIPSWENWVAHVATQISSLRLDLRRAAVLTDSSTLKALKLSKNLVLLSLSFPPNYVQGTPWEPTNEEPYTLDFPQLRELQYFLWTRQYAEALEIFAQSISAPKLEALTLCLVQRGRIDIEYKEISSSILITLSFLGESLRYLHLAHQSGRTFTLEDAQDQEWRHIWNWMSLWSNDRFQALVNLCPYLEHFVAPLPPDLALIGVRHHPTLWYIDAWVPPFDIDNSLQTPVCLVPDVNAFPFLRRCRHLDASLNVFMDLPTIFPPRDPTTADDRLVRCTIAGSVKVLESDCYVAPPAVHVDRLHSNRPALDAYRTRSDREIDDNDVSSDSESGRDTAPDEPMQVDPEQSSASEEPMQVVPEQSSAIDSDESDDNRYIPDDESTYSGSSEFWSDEGGLDGIRTEGTVVGTDVRPAAEANTIMASTTIIPGYFGQVLATYLQDLD